MSVKFINGKWNKCRYKIIKTIGQGGVGTIYKGVDELGKVVAIKVSDDINSITREYEFLKSLNTVYTPSVYDIDDFLINKRNKYFFVMEYIEGENIKEYMKNKVLSKEFIWHIGYSIASILFYIHKKGMIYGDIKAQNIMITRDKKVKIVDFGSICEKGCSIREYTALYDRSKFEKGLRVADELYDLFSLNILIINMILGQEVSTELSIKKRLKKCIQRGISKGEIKLISDAIDGKINMSLYLKEINKIKSLYKNKKAYEINRRMDKITNFMLISSIAFFFITLIMNIRRVLS